MECAADPYLLHLIRYMIYSIILSTIAWCGAFVLAAHAFLAKFKESDTYSPKMRLILLCYVVVMFGISTTSLIQDIFYTIGLSLGSNSKIFQTVTLLPDGAQIANCQFDEYGGRVIPPTITLSLALFGADSLMVWRCWVLCQGTCRTIRISINCLLTLSLIISVG
ncbi:hypothetical protein BDN70DRAFT_898039 [Pholiota conissans]|uniref:Uncharacterized protein n=1 Tax=Pholiota conissans TaxID=109636 RepID=A0A9P5YVT0_9AGAR|nr:hypothetical protein BDN70DRAFT_898039 [Pholiota conissans]